MTKEELDEWNDYVELVNKKIIALDKYPESKLDYIEEVYMEMKMNPNFYYANIMSWYDSQRNLAGCPVMPYETLYPSMFLKCKM